jgi:hypothetical protein
MNLHSIWEPEKPLFVVELGFKGVGVSVCDRHVVFAESPLEALGQGILMSEGQTLNLVHWRVYFCDVAIEQGGFDAYDL